MNLEDVKKPTLYSMSEVAEFMEISYNTLYKAVRSGKIKAINIAKSGTKAIYAFRAEDIQAYYDNLQDPSPEGIKEINE